jgi:hypothetical protein
MGDAKGKTKFFQYPKGLIAEPGFISKLKRVTMELGARKRREKNTERFQSLLLEFESRGKLPQDHSQFFLQR